MRIVSLTVLLYGADYLKYALASVNPAVDAQYVLYTSQGSHGHRTTARCPDTRDQLAALAIEGAGSKLRWVEKDFDSEGAQRDYIHVLEPDADCVIVVDADEVYSKPLIDEISKYVNGQENTKYCAKRYRLEFYHYWRSFKRGFRHDPALPERLIFPKALNDQRDTFRTNHGDVVHHFGYAQRSEIVRYKLETHGHHNEFRRDCDWFNDIFMTNRQYDCHPVGSDAWTCEDMDLTQLPAILNDHPFRNLDVIP